MHKNFPYLLGIDPSGNYNEGQGITGFIILEAATNKIVKHAHICAKDFESDDEYWQAILDFVDYTHEVYRKGLHVVIEDYMLYADKASCQINSRMETCRLLGLLQHLCWSAKISYSYQRAVDVKQRWSAEVLKQKGLFPKDLIIHELDAYRHVIHFNMFNNSGIRNKEFKVIPNTKGY